MKTFLTSLLAAISMAALGFLPFVPSLELPSVEAAPRTSMRLTSKRRTARTVSARIPKTSGLGPSARAAARLKNAPPRGWIGHYLPDDRYKVAGGIWKYVTTENDTYFHSPSCPLMLRQSAGSVIGFASVSDAEEAGYRFDAGCVSHAKTERYVMQQRNQRHESQVWGRQGSPFQPSHRVQGRRKKTLLLPSMTKSGVTSFATTNTLKRCGNGMPETEGHLCFIRG